ncbi:MAG: thioesterase family protein [Bacteroidota bacterium]
MKPFSEVLQTGHDVAGQGQTYILDESWMQGRGIYGGLSTALCLDGVKQQLGALPPLRSANINFIGPASKEVFVIPKLLRQGKSVSFVQAELMGEAGLITQAVFSFGAPRESRLEGVFLPEKSMTDPAASPPFFSDNGFTPATQGARPAFTHHFDVRLIQGHRPFSGVDTPSFELWVRHQDATAKDMTALIALADMPPPGILPMFKGLAPISSMSWMFNIIRNDLTNKSGWWFMRVEAEHAHGGYSSQNMSIRNDHGELVMVGRQNVAIFY